MIPPPTEHRRYMEKAIEEEKLCTAEDTRKEHPRVGVAVVHNGIITTAHRGEKDPGDHAEFTVLVKKLQGKKLPGAILYSTLEPCTSRVHPKKACWKWIVEQEIATVVIGILDPNPEVCGIGEWILKAHGVTVDHFPPDLQAEIERDNAEFIEQNKRALFKKLARLRSVRSIEVPCAHCGGVQEHTVRPCEWVTNAALDCSKCKQRFFVHLVGEGGDDFFTTTDGRRYGVPPWKGLSLPNAIRWALEKKQGWIEPRQLKGLLRLLRDMESQLHAVHAGISPNQLMKAMVNSQHVSSYGVTTDRIRSFFRFIMRAGYFASGWNENYASTYDKTRVVKCYVESALCVLRDLNVIRDSDGAAAATQFLLSETQINGDQIGREVWEELNSPPLYQEKVGKGNNALANGDAQSALEHFRDARQHGFFPVFACHSEAMAHLLLNNSTKAREVVEECSPLASGPFVRIQASVLLALADAVSGKPVDIAAAEIGSQLEQLQDQGQRFDIGESPLRFLMLGMQHRGMMNGSVQRVFDTIRHQSPAA